MSKHRTTCITILLPQISKPNPLFHNHLKECKKYPDQGKKGMILVPVANSKCKHFLVNRNIILKSSMNNLTLFSIEQSANFQPAISLRLQRRASIHSLFPELGTPVTMVSSPGTT